MRKALGILILLLSVGYVLGQTAPAKADDTSAADAKAQALKIYKAIQRQDWKEMFILSKYAPAAEKAFGSDVDAIAADIRKGIESDPEGKKVLDALTKNMADISVGEPTLNGDTAEVPTSSTVKLSGKVVTLRGVAKLIRSGSSWKWDMTFTDDIETATAQAMTDLLGTPE